MTQLEPTADTHPITHATFPPDDWAHNFIRQYAGDSLGVPLHALDTLGIPEHTYLQRFENDPDFKQAVETGNRHVTARLIHSILDRAINGTDQPLVSRGRVIGTTRTYDNKLSTWLLERIAPDQFDRELARQRHGDTPDRFRFHMNEHELDRAPE